MQVTLSQIESLLWESANILRGPVDDADFKSGAPALATASLSSSAPNDRDRRRLACLNSLRLC
ncbi:MAG: hypothetical protein FIB06_05575 [Betaproteobacteria bacterium]|nr:hypothetical protein [Betaproteobacteria bacterium]